MKIETPNHIAASRFFSIRNPEPCCTFNRWAWIPIGMILVVLIELMRAI